MSKHSDNFLFPYFIYYIYIYIYMTFVDKKNFELYFSDRLTFSNIRGKTSRRIYRLAVPLLSPEKHIGKYRHLVKLELN